MFCKYISLDLDMSLLQLQSAMFDCAFDNDATSEFMRWVCQNLFLRNLQMFINNGCYVFVNLHVSHACLYNSFRIKDIHSQIFAEETPK